MPTFAAFHHDSCGMVYSANSCWSFSNKTWVCAKIGDAPSSYCDGENVAEAWDAWGIQPIFRPNLRSLHSLLLCLAVTVNQIEMAGFCFESRLQVQRFSEIPEEGIHSNRACDDCVACMLSPWIFEKDWKLMKAYESYNVPRPKRQQQTSCNLNTDTVDCRHLLDAATIPAQASHQNSNIRGDSETTWNHLKPSETIWNHLKPSETIWNHLKPSETIWNHLKPSETTKKDPKFYGQVTINAHDWQTPRLEDLEIGSSSTAHVDNSRWMAQANRFRQEEMNEACSKDSVIVCIWPHLDVKVWDLPGVWQSHTEMMGNDLKTMRIGGEIMQVGNTPCSSIFRHIHLNDEAKRWIIANACISKVYQCTLYRTC